MKKWTRLGAAVLTLTLCLVFGVLLLSCMKPMEDRAYDLSLGWTTEAMPEGWVYDQKGWTVFLQEGETVTELTPDGFGGFDRLTRQSAPWRFFWTALCSISTARSWITALDIYACPCWTGCGRSRCW